MTQTYTKPTSTDAAKGYDPMLHGYQYQTSEQPVVAQSTSQQPTVTRINISLPSKPQPSKAKPVALAPVTAMSAQDWMNTPVQWNPAGVYGGIVEPRKGLPAWSWVLLGVLVLALATALFLMMM